MTINKLSSKIAKRSQSFILLFKSLIILYPIAVIAAWLGIFTPPKGYFSVTRIPIDAELNTIELPLRLLAGLVDMIPTAFVILSFYYLIKLFQLYTKNIIFSYANVNNIRKIGLTLIFQVFATLLVQPIITLILTFNAPKGQHMISIGVSSDEMMTLIIGGIVVLISWIMEQGRQLEEETALTV